MRREVVDSGMRALLWVALAAMVGCSGEAPGLDGDPDPGGGDAGTSTCARPEPGCPCTPGDEPVTCHAEPETTPEGLYCREGLMHCREGTWSSCETVRSFTLTHSATSLITDPEVCNPCNPDCFETTDRPDETDLSEDNSTNASYDPAAGGVVITQEPVNPDLPDSDGDGLPDLGEDVVADGGFFHVLPYGGEAEMDPMDVEVRITTADLYFLIDDSGSMTGEIANIKNDFTSGEFVAGCPGGLIGAIDCTIPDAWVGVGSFEEYPVWPYGYSGNLPYQHHLDVTDDTAAAQDAVDGLTSGGNESWPESQTQALWALATGNGLNGFVPDSPGCAGDEWGYACFRPDTIPIVILVTDAPFHNGPNPAHDYQIHYFEWGEYDLPPTFTPLGNVDSPYPDVGGVSGTWLGFSGNTDGHDDTWSGWGCGAGSSPDGAFYFSLSDPARVLFTTAGTSFDSVIGVVDRVNGWLYCDDDDSGMGTDAAMEVNLPAGRHMVVIDGDGAGQSGPFQVSLGTTLRPTWQDTVDALTARDFKVLVVDSSEGYADAYENSVALGNATGSVDDDGNPFVFEIDGDGTGLSTAVVDAVDQFANSTRFDVTVRAADPTPDGAEEDGPDNGVDETGFVESIDPIGWAAGDCEGTTADGFRQCTPGTELDLEVTFRNDFVQPLPDEEQVFDFVLEVVFDGTSVQQRIPVRIVVPAEVPTYPSPATYHRDYDASLTCEVPPERPDWGELSWETSTPSDTAIRFEIRTAASADDLAAADEASFTIPSEEPEVGSIDVGQLLLDAGLPINEPYLRITAVLLPSSDQLATPVLHGFDFQYNCVAGE